MSPPFFSSLPPSWKFSPLPLSTDVSLRGHALVCGLLNTERDLFSPPSGASCLLFYFLFPPTALCRPLPTPLSAPTVPSAVQAALLQASGDMVTPTKAPLVCLCAGRTSFACAFSCFLLISLILFWEEVVMLRVDQGILGKCSTPGS